MLNKKKGSAPAFTTPKQQTAANGSAKKMGPGKGGFTDENAKWLKLTSKKRKQEEEEEQEEEEGEEEAGSSDEGDGSEGADLDSEGECLLSQCPPCRCQPQPGVSHGYDPQPVYALLPQ